MDDLNPLNNINFPSYAQTIGSAGVAAWFEEKTQTVFDATPETIAWLQAQGWQDNGLAYDAYGNATGTLKKTQIKPQEVLNDLYKDYRNAYEEGRDVNEQRYRDIVYLYVNMFSDTEEDLLAMQTSDETFEDTIDTLLAQITTDYTSAETDMEGGLDDYGDSRRNAIEIQFDALLAKAKTQLIDRGMYNTTTWENTSSGVAREKAIALASIEDSIYEMQLKLKDRLYTLKTNMRDRLIAETHRVRKELQSSDMARLTLRNGILQALHNFMERRVDGYPDATAFGNIATQIGLGSPNSFAP